VGPSVWQRSTTGADSVRYFSKVYLNTVDQNLKNLGYEHLRYVDDIRVFCRSEVEAKQLLIDLSRLLRRRGLNLQSAKSKILSASDARSEIEDVTLVLRSVSREFIAEVVEQSGHGDTYINVSEADEILGESAVDAPIEVIRRTYQEYFINEGHSFNKTLFRFLLKRLAKQSDEFAGDHALGLLELQPEETHTILQYLISVYAIDVLQTPIADTLRSGRIVYHYQIYQIVSWLLKHCTNPSDELMDFIRHASFCACPLG
jgi:reverse transcriptase-like protein